VSVEVGLARAALIGRFFAGRAREIDCTNASVRDGLLFLRDHQVLSDNLGGGTPHGITAIAEVIRTVAELCVSSAFSLWCHRMVMEYVHRTDPATFPRDDWARRLGDVRTLGSTALGTAMAHLVGAGPLPMTIRASNGSLVVNGRVPWASNLFPPEMLVITAGVDDAGGKYVVAVPGDTPGLSIDPYPELLALQATGSSSLRLNDVEIPRDHVLSTEFTSFLRSVRPTFLLLQTALCVGLSTAALRAARKAIGGINVVFEESLQAAEARLHDVESRWRGWLATPNASIVPMRGFVQLRLDAALLAGEATRVEAVVTGGRGYVTRSDTARRIREAAFLPVQAPTEGQLRWELSRSA